MTKNNIDKYAENFEEYSVRGIRRSQLKEFLLKEFDEWFAGKAGFFTPDGELAYFIDDIEEFLKQTNGKRN